MTSATKNAPLSVASKESSPAGTNKIVAIWLFVVCVFIATMVVFGGYVRLTRSGLSMVEWDVIMGVIPPLTEADWQETFAKYQQFPEYQKLNLGMALQEYKFIFYKEYFHRILGRLTGLILVLPMFVFLVMGFIPRQKMLQYLGLGILFGLQGFMGWYMVSSGLVDKPHVSHFRLTAHLLFALLLLGICFWLGLNNFFGVSPAEKQPGQGAVLKLSIGLIIVLIVQIAYGGLVAGLKAGYVSSTFPLMFGYPVPPDLVSSLTDIVSSSITVHFIHRWLAFVVLGCAGGLYYTIKKYNYRGLVPKAAMILIAFVALQIGFGIMIIMFYVPPALALIHQGFALVLFITALFINHRGRYA